MHKKCELFLLLLLSVSLLPEQKTEGQVWARSEGFLRVSAVHTGWGLRRQWAARSTLSVSSRAWFSQRQACGWKDSCLRKRLGQMHRPGFSNSIPVNCYRIGSHISDGTLHAGSLIFTLQMCSDLSLAKPWQCRCRYSFFFFFQLKKLRLSRAKWCTQVGRSRKRLQRHQLPNPWSSTAQHSLSVNSFQEPSGKWSKAKWNQNEMLLQS